MSHMNVVWDSVIFLLNNWIRLLVILFVNKYLNTCGKNDEILFIRLVLNDCKIRFYLGYMNRIFISAYPNIR